tara:strand:+ start:762 stop:2486 length:1725 start_codon:yes stop_codon:yes gene_type:complete
MGSILDKYVTVIPKLQSESIKKRIYNQIKDTDGITTEEVRAQYEADIREIVGQPAPNIYKGFWTRPGRAVASEVFQGFFTDISYDLTALFGEYDTILKAGALQSDYYKHEIVEKLRVMLREARTEVLRIKSLTTTFAGEMSSLADDFDHGDSEGLDPGDPLREVLVRDYLRQLVPNLSEMMLVDSGSESLVLPIVNRRNVVYFPRNQRTVEIHRAGSVGSTTPSDSNYDRRFNDDEDIFRIRRGGALAWEHKVIKDSPMTTGASLALVLSIADSGANVNHIKIDVASGSVRQIKATKADGSVVELFSVPTGETGTLTVIFPESQLREISIAFHQGEHHREDIGGLEAYTYRFTIGLVEVSYVRQGANGYYASRTLRGLNQSIFQLSSETNNSERGVIEYYLHYREYGSSSRLVESKRIPILPIDKTDTFELIYLRADNSATLRFRVLKVEDITLMRDGVPLVPVNDFWISNVVAANEVAYEVPTSIVLAEHVDINAEFTARYIPHWCDEALSPNYTDPLGQTNYRAGNIVEIHRRVESVAVRSECNLAIVVRATGDKRLGPSVLNYTLSVGERQ